jgi:hypothetical protein
MSQHRTRRAVDESAQLVRKRLDRDEFIRRNQVKNSFTGERACDRHFLADVDKLLGGRGGAFFCRGVAMAKIGPRQFLGSGHGGG